MTDLRKAVKLKQEGAWQIKAWTFISNYLIAEVIAKPIMLLGREFGIDVGWRGPDHLAEVLQKYKNVRELFPNLLANESSPTSNTPCTAHTAPPTLLLLNVPALQRRSRGTTAPGTVVLTTTPLSRYVLSECRLGLLVSRSTAPYCFTQAAPTWPTRFSASVPCTSPRYGESTWLSSGFS
jgi:hypothetical protein